MFQSGYILLVLLAAAPLIRTLLKGRDGGASLAFLHRIYRDFAYIAAAVVAIICFETALNISLQNYWFEELGQRYRYWLALGLCLGIFFTVLVSVGIFLGSNLRALCRPLPAVPRSAPWFAAFIFAALVGFGATTLWTPLLGFLGANATGTSDPVFGKDISFYLLVLPWYDAVVSRRAPRRPCCRRYQRRRETGRRAGRGPPSRPRSHRRLPRAGCAAYHPRAAAVWSRARRASRRSDALARVAKLHPARRRSAPLR